MADNGRYARAIAALIVSPSVSEAAESAGIAERTLWRWMSDPEFEIAYREARQASVTAAIAKLQRTCGAAVDTLAAVMDDPAASASARVAAARCVLDTALRAIEYENLEVRIAALEQAGGFA